MASFLRSYIQPNTIQRILLLFALITAVHPAPETAADEPHDWPFVRGPHFNGHSDETELTDGWDKDGPPVLWTRRLGQGYSAFVARNQRVFTQGQNLTGQYLYCLDADTGETIWEYRYDWPYEAAGVYPGPRSTPTLSADCVYLASPDGLLACLHQDDGSLLWSINLDATYGISGCDFGYSCSPTLVDGMIIVPVGGRDAGVVAFDADSGSEVWRSTSEPASYTPVLPVNVGSQALAVCYMQNALLVLNRKTGGVVRRRRLSQGYDEHSAWPIYEEPYLWLSGPFRSGSWLVDLSETEESGTDVEVVWRSEDMSNDVCSSVCADGYIYGFDLFDVQAKTHRPSRGIFRCMDLKSGDVKWSVGTGRHRRTSNAEEFENDIGQSGLIAADGKLIILNELGELILLEIDSNACRELARCTVLGGELTWTPPCLHNRRLYVRNQSQAVCVYLGQQASLPDVPTYRLSELPQREYHNLAASILAVEPEYAFDIPHNRWLIQWFLAGCGVLILGRLIAIWISPQSSRQPLTELIVVFGLGAAGTTMLGRLTGEFVFTWPVCLYAALEYAVQSPSTESNVTTFPGKLRRRVPLLIFVGISVAYFLICRRLSLVFEWAFLFGFVGALPVVWIAHRISRLKVSRTFSRIAVSLIGFSALYGTSVAFLKYRY